MLMQPHPLLAPSARAHLSRPPSITWDRDPRLGALFRSVFSRKPRKAPSSDSVTPPCCLRAALRLRGLERWMGKA